MSRKQFDVRHCYTKDEWNRALQDFPEYDYVHTYDFHRLSQNLGEGRPVLIVVRNDVGQAVICWPGLKRPIAGSDLFDISSVYGYGGPLIRAGAWTSTVLDALFDVMAENRIVSLFSRMHPLLNANVGELMPHMTKVSDVPVIDIGLQPETLASYSRDHRGAITRLMRRGAHVVVDEDLRHLDEFVDLYQQTMRAIGAREYFFFNRDFFEGLAQATDFKAILQFVSLDNINVAGSLLIQTGGILHGYLAGVAEQHRHLAPSKMLYKSAHEWAIEHGLRAVILGPGRPQEGDSLLKFKQGFGRLTLPLHVFKKVVNPSAYEELCSLRGIAPASTDFFPAYRAAA